MSSKEKKGIAIVLGLIALIVITIYSIKILSMSFDVPECDKLTPIPAEGTSSPDIMRLNFNEKTVITFGKYGFRKKIVVEEPCIIIQDASGPKTDHAYFGIFEDEELNNPIEIVDFTWLYKDGAFEEGEMDEKPYDENRDGIIVLQPGTYYAAIYSTSPFDDFEALYASSYCPLNLNVTMEEGKTVNFYCIKDDQVNTLKIQADREGRIRIATNLISEGILEIFDDKGIRIARHETDVNGDQRVSAYLDVKKGHQYEVKISELPPEKEPYLMFLYTVKYQYIR